MEDERRTQKQFVADLAELRQRLASEEALREREEQCRMLYPSR
jgi:hypothetical protein